MGDLETALREIEIVDIAGDLAEVHFINKEAEAERGRLKDVFFKAVAATFEAKDLARKTVEIPEDITAADSLDYALKYHPGFRLAEGEQPEDSRKVILEEDPALKTYTEVVPVEGGVIEEKKGEKKTHPGYVVTKTVKQGTVMLDDERLKKLDPALYDATMVPQGYKWIADMVYEQNVDLDDVDEVIANFLPEDWPLVLRDDLSAEETQALTPYSYEGPKGLALNVRYAKPSEI